jgi:hypothetical protein
MRSALLGRGAAFLCEFEDDLDELTGDEAGSEKDNTSQV